mmetsp:Transcript_57068/g.124872  ORF Transcript_57068/g.124872 Transcript_57068/m.124872 type:complete len:107 (-) Transcript_57068:1566-1886(-)
MHNDRVPTNKVPQWMLASTKQKSTTKGLSQLAASKIESTKEKNAKTNICTFIRAFPNSSNTQPSSADNGRMDKVAGRRKSPIPRPDCDPIHLFTSPLTATRRMRRM